MRYRSPTVAGATSLYFALFLSDALVFGFLGGFFVYGCIIKQHHTASWRFYSISSLMMYKHSPCALTLITTLAQCETDTNGEIFFASSSF